jgi:hypothetical protein
MSRNDAPSCYHLPSQSNLLPLISHSSYSGNKNKRAAEQADMAPYIPPELIARIASHASKDTQFNMTLSSRQFYDLVTPHLYQDLNLMAKDSSRDRFYLQHLTLFFVRRPDLAAHVRRLRIRPGLKTVPWDTSDIAVPGATAKMLDVSPEVKSAIRATATTRLEGVTWLRRFHGHNEDAVMEFLLPRLPALRILNVEIEDPAPCVSFRLHS